MPTGYTAAVGDGDVTEFPDFAMKCARAFGALIEMRDSGPDATIPDAFEPSDYHARALADAEKRVRLYNALGNEEADRLARADFEKAHAAWVEAKEKKAQTRLRYEVMLAEVRKWKPPTTDHEGLKTFMVEQLEKSIRFDCGDTEKWYPEPKLQTGADWLFDQRAKAVKDVAYHRENYAEDVRRAEERSAWVRELRESLRTAAEPPSEARTS